MKMTSKFTLLLTLAGVVGLGCSAPEDGGEDPPSPPPAPPPFFGMQQQPAGQQMQQPAGGNMQMANPLQPAPGAGGMGATPGGAPGAGGAPNPGGMGTGGQGQGVIPTGTGLAITPTAGFVAGTTNEVGIQGYFYTFNDNMDGGNTTIQPADFSMAMGSTICASGVGAQVLVDPATTMPAYGRYWGGGIGLNLAEPGGMAPPQPWMRGRVVGFSFNITGTQVPPAGRLRFKATFYEGATVNFDYCVNAAMGANMFRFDQIVNQCYTGGLMAPALPATAPLQALQWQVATDVAETTPFNFCVENLRAIVQ